ncbi:MAG: alpha/beta hydrolase [Alphaproteobacteria bacterium]|nr:alpha/beta hydrolase [Alphaproteobacteria bacterium]
MAVKDRETLRAMLAERAAAAAPGGLAEQRAGIDGLSAVFPVPSDVTVEASNLGGVKGEWVRAPGARKDAALLYLHGGGYVIGSPTSHRHLVALISRESGLPVFSADYRLAPEHPFPAAVDDAVAACDGMIKSGITPANIAIAGDSAGGGLTAAALVAIRDRKLPRPGAGVMISPWSDLSLSGASHKTRKDRDPMVGGEGLSGMLTAYAGTADVKHPLISPAFADLKGLPPLLIQVGSEEVLHDDAVMLRDRAEADGVDVSFESWGGMVHVWPLFHPILGEGRDAVARIGSFLRNHIS